MRKGSMFSKPEPALVFDETLTQEEEELYLVGIDMLGDSLAYACLRKDAEPRYYPTKPQIMALQLSREPTVANLAPSRSPLRSNSSRSPSVFSRSSSSSRLKQRLQRSRDAKASSTLDLGSLGPLETTPSLTSSSLVSTPPSSIVSFKKWRKQEFKEVLQSVPQVVPLVPEAPDLTLAPEMHHVSFAPHKLPMGPPPVWQSSETHGGSPTKPQSLRVFILQDSLKSKLVIRERPSIDLARKIDRPVSLAYTPGAYWRMSGVDQSHLGAYEATQMWKRSKNPSTTKPSTDSELSRHSTYETSSWGIITPEDSVSNINTAQSRGNYEDCFDFELPDFDPNTERLNRRPIVL